MKERACFYGVYLHNSIFEVCSRGVGPMFFSPVDACGAQCHPLILQVGTTDDVVTDTWFQMRSFLNIVSVHHLLKHSLFPVGKFHQEPLRMYVSQIGIALGYQRMFRASRGGSRHFHLGWQRGGRRYLWCGMEQVRKK